MAAPLGQDALPEHWSYGVRRDGRVFFIDDETRTTAWLHPLSGEPVNSGHMIRSDLPRGWEEGFSEEGVAFFIDHNQRTTTFRHPVTGRISPDNLDYILQDQLQGARMMSRPAVEQLSSTTVSEASTGITSSTVDTTASKDRGSPISQRASAQGSRVSGKVHSFGKRQQSIKRNPNVPVVVRGWLYKQDSSGMRLWKRKWFVLADFCLFYYKDSREEAVLGSIPLPSYVISPVGPEDHISRKYAFKASHTGMRSYIYKQSSVIGSQAEHGGMRTYYFSADTQEDMSTWLRAMNQAALMQKHADAVVRPLDQFDHFSMTQQHSNHVNHHKTLDSDVTRPIVHEVLLEPIHRDPEDRFPKDSPGATLLGVTAGSSPLEMDTHSSLPANPTSSTHSHSDHVSASAPVSRVSSRAPSRSASTLPSSVCTRNGLVSTPSPILEPNGIAAGTYQRVPASPEEHKGLRRRSALEQVEHWIQVQKADVKGPPSRENTLPRRTPPTQHKFTSIDAYQTLPKTPRQSPPAARLGEYKYAQDRMSHFHLTPEQTGSNTVLQLYEWQQRHQFRHGSPTAPLYTPAPDYPFGSRPPSTVPPSAPKLHGSPRCVSVPPSTLDIPPPGPPPGSSRTLSPTRRPHTPAGRVTVRPPGDRSVVDLPFAVSPRRSKSQMIKTATMERRSMPPGYITHTVSAPSLHGKTVDDTYVQLKKDLEYLDLKVAGSQTQKESGKPVKVAESDVDVKLSRLCEQDKILKDLEMRISSLKEDKDKLESVLDVSHQQMERYQAQLGHAQKIAYQQRLLQEDLVSIRAQISRQSTEMAVAWEEYVLLERSVEQLRTALLAHMNHGATPQQEKNEVKRELWRIEDVMAGLSASKANYKITIESIQNPERKLVPSVSDSDVPSPSADVHPPPRSSTSSFFSQSEASKWSDDGAPPRPPLPHLYDYEETPPEVPPLPKEASVIRHTSVRGLKRQSDERKRDRETGSYVVNGDCKPDLRSYQSEPELPGVTYQHTSPDGDSQYFQNKGLSGSSSRLTQSSTVSSFVTLRRGPGSTVSRERPKSAMELLSPTYDPSLLPGAAPRGRMSAEEQLERMKRHQRALVRERKRNLSQSERSSVVSQRSSSASFTRPTSFTADSVFDLPEERLGAEGQSDEGWNPGKERPRYLSPDWTSNVVREADVEPLDFDLDISRELSRPPKVPIPERYIESDPDEPLSPEEQEERQRTTQRIQDLLAKSSLQSVDFSELDSVLQQQKRIMSVSHALASEASFKSKVMADTE